MYRNCIFCSGALGANQVLEAFPVGRRVAFDAQKGRLWVLCPRCARWNLAPLEERWEVVEAADRLFSDARLRVQSENVGLARLPDGTRLIRVGEALRGELAAWRYGDQLVRRRRQYVLTTGALVAATVVIAGGAMAAGAAGGLYGIVNLVTNVVRERRLRQVLHRVSADRSPTGRALAIRRWHVLGAWMEEADDGIALHVPDVGLEKRPVRFGSTRHGKDAVVLPDALARPVLSRAMVHVNDSGASRQRLSDALRVLEDAGSADDYVRRTARAGRTVGKRGDMTTRRMSGPEALALEMALHEEQERRAMEGELVLLEAAWRQAEEVAAIADALPDDPLDRLKRESA